MLPYVANLIGKIVGGKVADRMIQRGEETASHYFQINVIAIQYSRFCVVIIENIHFIKVSLGNHYGTVTVTLKWLYPDSEPIMTREKANQPITFFIYGTVAFKYQMA